MFFDGRQYSSVPARHVAQTIAGKIIGKVENGVGGRVWDSSQSQRDGVNDKYIRVLSSLKTMAVMVSRSWNRVTRSCNLCW